MTLSNAKIIMGLGKNQRIPAVEITAIQRLLLLTKHYIYRTKAAKGSLNTESMKFFIKFQTLAEFGGVKEGQSASNQRLYNIHKLLCL